MLRVARSSVDGRLIRNTFCYGSEVVPVQSKRGLRPLGLQVVSLHLNHIQEVGYFHHPDW